MTSLLPHLLLHCIVNEAQVPQCMCSMLEGASSATWNLSDLETHAVLRRILTKEPSKARVYSFHRSSVTLRKDSVTHLAFLLLHATETWGKC